jgi:hypothetical protein
LQRRTRAFEDQCAENEIRQAQSDEKLRALELRCSGLEEKYLAEKEAREGHLSDLERQRQEQRAGIAAFEDALKVAEERVALVQKQHRMDQTGWLAARSHLQRRFEELETELDTLQSRHEAAMAQTRADREGWETARLELVRRHEEAEKIREELARDCQSLQTRVGELEEIRSAAAAAGEEERRHLQQRVRELDDRVRTLEQQLAESEAKSGKFLEEREWERSRFEELRAELENQRQARVVLEDALHLSETRRVELQEKGEAERAEYQSAQKELEAQRASLRALEDALRAAEARLAGQAEDRKAESADLAALRRELAGQRAARLALGRVLRAAEAKAEPDKSAVPVPADLAAPAVEPAAQYRNSLDENDPRRMAAARGIDAAGRAAGLAESLPTPSHGQETADLNAIATQVTAQTQFQPDDRIEFLTIFSPRLPRVLVSPSLMQQLLTALLQFAGDALPLGGIITLETRFCSAVEIEADGIRATISATVSGCSIQLPADASVLEQVVLDCRGKLAVYGDPVTGITIEISLPAQPAGGR